MTPKSFTTLAIAAIASLAIAAVVHTRADSWSTGTPEGAKLIPNLQREMAKIATISMKQANQSLVLERKGDQWTLKDRGGYPAQGDRVRTLLLRLSDAVIVDGKTRNPERYGLLELDDVGAKDSKSRQLVITDDKARAITDLIIGKRSVEQFGAGKGGTYVRRPGERETWLVSTEIDVNPAPNQWVDTTIFEAEIAKVKRVEVNLGGEKVIVEREAGKPANKDAYKLVGMPEGKKLKTDYTLEDLVNAFARVELEDVRKQQPAPAGAKPPYTATFEMENGSKIGLSVVSEGDQRWATVEATGEGDAKEAAEKLTARTKGWQYRLPNWKYEQIFKKQADLLDDVKS